MEKEKSKSILDSLSYFTPFSVDIFNHDHPDHIREYMSKFQSAHMKIKDILFDFSTAEFIQDKLVPHHGLDLNQGKEINRVIRDVLLAHTFIGDMIGEVQAKLAVQENMAKNITSMIVSELFAPAIEEIKKMQEEKFNHRLKTVPNQENKPKEEIQFKPEEPTQKKVFSNPAASLDVNRNNILDLRNRG